MRRLGVLLVGALMVFSCASNAFETRQRDETRLLVSNQAWNQATIYVEGSQRRLGTCGAYASCSFRLRPSDTPDGRLRVSYRELTWERARRRFLPEVFVDEGVTWELLVGHLPEFSYMRPARVTEGDS